MPLLGFLVSALGIFARMAIGSMILKVLLILGVGIASTAILEPFLESMLAQSEGALLAVPSPFGDYLALARVDDGVAIIASAAIVRAKMAGLKLIANTVT